MKEEYKVSFKTCKFAKLLRRRYLSEILQTFSTMKTSNNVVDKWIS